MGITLARIAFLSLNGALKLLVVDQTITSLYGFNERELKATTDRNAGMGIP